MRVHYISAPYDSQEGFAKYRDYITHLEEQNNAPTQVLYLAVPPSVVSPILSHFSLAFPDREVRDIRVILEKPFGHDEASARTLLSELREYYSDEELYFLDHYMGKKSMRSLLSLRAKNRIIDTMIDPSQIARIEVSALEDFDVRDRVGYFDSVGIIRDMIQSHLFQMLALITLDLPEVMDPPSIALARERLIGKLMFTPEKDQISIGQYASYTSDHEMTRDSSTETFVALTLTIADPRWSHIPIYMRSGKSLEHKETYIVITFLPSSHARIDEEPNHIIISLYPEEEISMRFLDESGDRRETHEIITRDSIAGDPATYLGSHELLFLDAIEHERRFFLTPPEILASWQCIDRLFAYIRDRQIQPEIYENHSS
jgi:glucose-6-phosphate 1-dehydrogenase